MHAFLVGRTKPTVAIVGCGTVGTAIGKLLRDAGYRITGVATSTLETARRAAGVTGSEGLSDCPWEVTRGADVVFITTPDDLIESTCMSISQHRGFEKNAVAIHCSGALSSDILSSARECGAVVATLHPLQSFASVDQAVTLVPGSFCTIEGDKSALPIVRQMVKDLGGILLEICFAGRVRYLSTVDFATPIPIFRSSPTMRGEPQSGLAEEILRMRARSSVGMPGRPGFPARESLRQ